MAELARTSCLEASALIELAERGVKATSYRQHIAHIAECPACRATLRELKQTEAARPRRSWLPTLPGLLVPATASACAVLLVAVLAMKPDAPPPAQVAVGGAVNPVTLKPAPTLMVKGSPRPVVIKATPSKTVRRSKLRKSRRITWPPVHHDDPIVVPDEGTKVASMAPAPTSTGTAVGEVGAANTETGEVSSANSVEGEVIPAPPTS